MNSKGEFDEVLDQLIAQLLADPRADVLPLLGRCPAQAGEIVRRLLELRETGILRDTTAAQDRAVEFLRRSYGIEGAALSVEPAADKGLPQELVAARYRFVARLAQGGMGELFLGYDLELKRSVALKVLHRALPQGALATGGVFSRFLNEACVTAQLDHPAIVPVHDLGLLSDRRLVMVMKLVRGKSLSEWIKALNRNDPGARQRFHPRALIETAMIICRSVAHAHRRRVIHRDLKPSNVMIGEVGEVYVMDWGIAKLRAVPEQRPPPSPASGAELAKDLTTAGDSIGTPAYMSPEQALGLVDQFDERTDVFGLGALIYHFATGKPPMWDETEELTLERARTADLNDRAGRQATRRVRRELLAVCNKATQEKPADRYGSVEELIADLEAILEERRGTAWIDPVHARTVKLVRRHPRATAVITAAALVVVAGSIAYAKVTRSEAYAAEAIGRQQVFEDQDLVRQLESDLVRIDALETNATTAIDTTNRVALATRRTEDERVAQHRRFSASAREFVALLESWSIPISAAEPAEIADALRFHRNSDARPKLIRAFYLLAKHLVISGLAETAIYDRHRGAPADEAEAWATMARANPDLVAIWWKVNDVLEALGDQAVGLRTLRALSALAIGGQDTFGLLDGVLDRASDGELEILTFYAEDRDAEVVPFLERVIENRPELFWPRARRARVAILRALRMEGDERTAELGVAIAEGTAAVALWPESDTTWINLAHAWGELGDLERAGGIYERLVARTPGYASAWFNLGCIRRTQRRWTEALQALETAREIDPSDSAVHMMCGLLYNDYATELILNQAEEEPQNPRVSPLIDAAFTSFRTYITLVPGDWQGYFRLGETFLLADDFEEAIASFDEGLELHPHGQDLRLSKAEVLWETGKRSEALQLMEELLHEFPGHPHTLEFIQYLLTRTADPTERAGLEHLLALPGAE